MQRIILSSLIIFLVIAGLSLPPARGAETPSPPSISVEAEGKVMATPDLARLTLEVETQAATAAGAAQDNAQRADRVLKAVKQVLGPEDKLRTLGYRLMPVYAAKDKSSPPEIKAYRAVNQPRGEDRGSGPLGPVMDAALKSGASQVRGPYWEHAHQEELAAAGGGECPGTGPAPGGSSGPGRGSQDQRRGQNLHRDSLSAFPGWGGNVSESGQSCAHPHRSGGRRDQGPYPGGIPGKPLTWDFPPGFLYKACISVYH